MEISKEEFRLLKIKAKRLDEIDRLITNDIISLYVRPGACFDYGDYKDSVVRHAHCVVDLSSFDDENGLNALTNHPQMIEELIIISAVKQKKMMDAVINSKPDVNIKKSDPTVNIYLMRNTRNGYVKIGMTSGAPKYRESTLQSQEPEVELMFSFKGKQSLEKDLHTEFDSKRLRGEWFDLSDDDVDSIKKRFCKNTKTK